MEILASALVAAFGLVVVAGLFLTVCDAAMTGSLERNSATGIRTRETIKSDAAWKAGHRAARPVFKATGWWTLALAAALVVVAVVASGTPVIVLAVGALAYATVIGGALRGKAVADRAARQVID